MSREPLRALLVDEVPLWDAKVRNILLEVRTKIMNRTMAPIRQREAIASRQFQLQELVEDLENGEWEEGVLAPRKPELEQGQEPDTAVLPGRSVWAQAALEFDRRAAERLPWLEEAGSR